MCDMTHLHVRHDWFIPETWLIYITRHRQFVTQDTDSSCLMSCVTYEDMWPTWDRNCLCQRCLVSRTLLSMDCDRMSMSRRDVTYHVCDMRQFLSHLWYNSFLCATRRIHTWDMAHSHVWHDSFICVTWIIHVCDIPHSYVQHDSFTCATCVRHDSFTCATWLIHMCDMTHSHVQHGSFICVTWLIHICDMTHSC